MRRAATAVFRRPKPDFATVNALYHPDHEQITYVSRIEGPSSSRGAGGFRAWLDSIGETFASWETSLEGVSEIDDDRVLVEGVFTASGNAGECP